MKRFQLALTLFLILFVLVKPVFAAQILNSVTLNGSSSVTVAPSSSITVVINVTTTSGSNWNSTSWDISGINCVDHADHTTNGTYDESFSITAPSSPGTYSISFVARGNNNCGLGSSNTYTMTNAITVSAPTPTPTAGPTPTPTPTLAPGVPTPTPTPTSGSSSTDTSSSSSTAPSTTYYPSLTLDVFQNPTNRTSLNLLGTARVEQGNISLVEYTLTNGASWMQAQPTDGSFNNKDERFTISISSLAEGKHTLKVRAKTASGVLTQEDSYVSQEIIVATSPPVVTLDAFAANPTTDQTPTLTGKVVTRLASVTRAEVSLDGGKSWHPVSLSSGRFSFTPATLDDGNYPVVARALDSAGNIGLSDRQVLIIDTIPPIIGGSMMSVGPQVLTPKENGNVSVAVGALVTMAISMEGGVTEAEVQSGSNIFPLKAIEGDNLWVGDISFDTPGGKPLNIKAVDGAGNTTQRKFNTLIVESSGVVTDDKTASLIQGAKVSLYTYDPISSLWVLWDSESYGQENPQLTDSNGHYSFIVPAGKYYIDAKAKGYGSVQSEIITLAQTSVLNYPLELTPNAKIQITLPFIGDLQIVLPSFAPPQTLSLQNIATPSEIEVAGETFKTGVPAPDFSLPNIEGVQVGLSDFTGKRLLLSFISPWSAPSLEQAFILSESSENIPEEQAILVVSLQESIATTQTLMNRGRYLFPVVADKDGLIASSYQVATLPHHVLIDSDGKISEVFTGVFTKEQLLEKLSNTP